MESRKVLILASVASMIDQFNIPNIKLLIEMGYEVHVACNFIEGNTCSDDRIRILKEKLFMMNVLIHQIDFNRNVMSFGNNIKAYRQVRQLAITNKYKFIHCHSPIGGVAGRLVGKTTKTKVIYTAHGFHFYKDAPMINWLIYYPIEKWLSKYTDVLITINKEDNERALREFHAKKTVYINGVGVEVLPKTNERKIEKKKEIDLPINSSMILSVGELNKNKNHEIIIKALSIIDNPEVHYVICGKGNLELYLKKLASELGLSENVHFLGFREDIREIYCVTDIFAFPSFREGLSVSLMEAMAEGLPIVCSDIRGNRDLVIDSINGYLISSNSDILYAEKIAELLEDKEKREIFGEQNKNIIRKFSLEEVMKKTKLIYEGVSSV